MTAREDLPGGMLLVTVDRLPAWILPAYGCTWGAMPALDGLAARGVVWDRLLAASDDPLATLGGLAGRGAAAAAGWPLLQAATAAGWEPTVVTDDPTLAAGLPVGVAVRQVAAAGIVRRAADEADTNLARLFAAAAAVVAAGGCRFLWCHAASLARAWDAPPDYRDAFVDPDDPPPPPGATVPDLVVGEDTDPDLVVGLRHVFAGQLALLDACLDRLLAAVAARADEAGWTVLAAGVRGIGLGLHGRVGCGPLPPYGELVHLPAILVDHRGRMAGQRHGGLVVPADLGATLLESAGAAPAGDDDPRTGRSLTALFEAWRHRGRDRVICVGHTGVAVATPAWHLVVPHDPAAPPRLFAKPDDFFEACDVADRCPEVAAELEALARRAVAEPALAWAAPLSAAATQAA